VPTPESATAPLPPLRIAIPKIGVDWPVVLSDNEHLPEFRGVGWLMGSSFPGVPGNMVLFGHLGGAHGTFMRLHELQPGDEFSIFTEARELRYRVRSSHETTPDDVGVLAPTDNASATLITCSGPWDPIVQTNQRRLIVSAEYVAQ
jgi:sortase A